MSALVSGAVLAQAQTADPGNEPARIYVRLPGKPGDHGLSFQQAYQLWRDLGIALDNAARWQPPAQ